MNLKSLLIAVLCLAAAGQSFAQIPIASTWTLALTGQYGTMNESSHGNVTTETGVTVKEKITMPQIVAALAEALGQNIPLSARLVMNWDGVSDPTFSLNSGPNSWDVTSNITATISAECVTGSTSTNAVTGQFTDQSSDQYELELTIDKSPSQSGFDESSFYLFLEGVVSDRRKLTTAKDGSVIGTVSSTISGLVGWSVIGTGDSSNPYNVDLVTGTGSGSGQPAQ
jgi:hypothetical protein